MVSVKERSAHLDFPDLLFFVVRKSGNLAACDDGFAVGINSLHERSK